MEEFAPNLLYAVDESALQAGDDRDDAVPQLAGRPEQEQQPGTPKRSRTLRNGIFRAANLQDKLLEKYQCCSCAPAAMRRG